MSKQSTLKTTIKTKRKQNVILRKMALKNGDLSLYLDIYRSGKRSYEFLKLYIKPNPRTPFDKAQNKENLELAENIRKIRETELNHNEFNIVPPHKLKTDFLLIFQSYIDTYTKKDIRMLNNSFVQFKEYLSYNEFDLKKGLKPIDLTHELIEGFKEYLTNKFRSPASYFKRFKKVLKYATDKHIINENPAKDIFISDRDTLTKDILSIKEIQTLANSYCGNEEVKKAFLFCCYTGLRWCDVRVLKYKNIDFDNKTLKFTQIKTEGSKNANVTMDLNQTVLKLIGEPKERENNIFNLPSHNGALDSLKRWIKKAGITKHITWHCARHTFAVLLLDTSKTDVKTMSSLLGHSGLKHTEVYTHIINENKKKAINKLPKINL